MAPPIVQRTPFARVNATLQRPRSSMKPAAVSGMICWMMGKCYTDSVAMLEGAIDDDHQRLLTLRGVDRETARVEALWM